jgi:DNA-directed RNA polymerase subunit omega
MARVTVEDCLQFCANRFALVHLAAKRTKQLMKGSRSLVENPGNKPAVLALREIAEEKVRLPEGWVVVDIDKPAVAELPPDQREE